MEIEKRDVGNRLPNLDPNKRYLKKYWPIIKNELGKHYRKKSSHPLTLTFAVGGAGAEKHYGESILASLGPKIRKHEIRLNLIAGTRPEIYEYFRNAVTKHHLEQELDQYINIQFSLHKKGHFEEFNKLLHTTDILWTKPSELSFYTALGLPIIIAPPLGKHEEYNRDWLVHRGTGYSQDRPDACVEWLYDWLDKGFLAEAAWEGYLETPKYGTYNIEKLVFSKDKECPRCRF
jgi:UDP-N-acetylglucosamine:LPS N-acetylglucosamine transferase